MPSTTRAVAAAVAPTASAIGRLSPLGAGDIDLGDGFWSDRLRRNREVTIPHGFGQLEATGTLDNLRVAAGRQGTYRALSDTSGTTFPFLDSDVYKWLEGVGWALGRGPDAGLAAMADEAIAAVAAAQQPDGYVNSFVQVVGGGRRYRDLAWGHEMYCLGHLIQAAIAWQRALGDDRLLQIARAAADELGRTFGADGTDGIDGHPEVEMALVELYRTTGEAAYLDLARLLIDRRGHGRLGDGRFGRGYWQDHEPVRSAATVTGHAVRQLYLDCGAVDVAVETGDTALLEAVLRRWRDMVATRSYLTGAIGSRHKDEAFGDPYELPPDRAYAETCAAIARVMLGWRLLLATGDPAIGDDIERTLYNAVLPGLSLDGASFFYVNPLQRRTIGAEGGPDHPGRAAWYACACCPPNLMRVIASLPQMIASTDEGGVHVHQFASGEIRADKGIRLAVETGYPWNGRVTITVVQAPAIPWTLSVRVPGWATSARLAIAGGESAPSAVAAPVLRESRTWRPGDTITLDLDLPVRVTRPYPRIDAVRGCVALERGPLVYCVESPDLPAGVEVEDLAIHPDVAAAPVPRPDLGPDVVGLVLPALAAAGGGEAAAPARPVEIGAIPYFAWGNRGVRGMRVWIPTDAAAPRETEP